MKTHVAKCGDKGGGILVVVVLVMLIVSVLIAGLLMLQTRGGVETIQSRQSEQAFWLAESGIQEAIQKLNWEPAFRANPTNFSGTSSKGTYTVVVPPGVLDSSSFFSTTNYTITATGQVQGMRRRIQQEVSTTPGSKMLITSKSGPAAFNSNVEIHDGGIAIYSGTIDTGNNSTVDLGDSLFVKPGVTVVGSGDYDEVQMPATMVEPTFNEALFQTRIANVTSRGVASTDLEVSESTLAGSVDYTSNNVVFSSAITIPDGTTISSYGDLTFRRGAVFQGSVTIEAGGNVSFPRSSPLPDDVIIIAGGNVEIAGSVTIGENTEVISGGNLSMGNQMSFNSGSVFYADQDLTVASGGANTTLGDGIAFLANGNVELNSNFNDFRGIIYANGGVDFNANMDIYGTVVGEVGFDATSNVDFFFDPSAYQWVLNPAYGIGLNLQDVILTKKTWQEIAPN